MHHNMRDPLFIQGGLDLTSSGGNDLPPAGKVIMNHLEFYDITMAPHYPFTIVE